MTPTDLSRCDQIPVLKRLISEMDQQLHDASPGRLPYVLSPQGRADDALKFEELARDRDRLMDQRKQAQREGDSEKLRDLDRRLNDLESEIAKLRHRDYLRLESPTDRQLEDRRRQRRGYQRELDELEKFCRKFVTENVEPNSSPNENISTTNSQGAGEGRLRAELARVGDSPDDVLLKPVAAVTQAEVDRVMADPDFGQPTDRGRALADRTQAWFDHVWGTGPAARDDTGRAAEAAPVNPPPSKPSPLFDAEGQPVDRTLGSIGAELDRLAGDPHARDGEEGAVRALQRAVNLSARLARSPGARAPADPGVAEDARLLLRPALAVDGVLGDKTRRQTRAAAALLGQGKLSEGLALGRFQDFAEHTAATGATTPAALNREVRSGFGSLFNSRHKPEASALQDTLNELGTARGPARFTSLAVDGVLGPKTSSAFEQAVRRNGPAAVTEAFGRRLGFLDSDDEVGPAFGAVAIGP